MRHHRYSRKNGFDRVPDRHIAAGLHLGGSESYPDVFQPFGGFADGIEAVDSHVGLPDIPGVGFEAKSKLHALMKTLTD